MEYCLQFCVFEIYDDIICLINKKNDAKVTLSEYRRKSLRKLIDTKDIIRVVEPHDGLTGLIAENTKINKEGKIFQFDAMLVLTLCVSLQKGKPDIELVDFSSRCDIVDEIMDVTSKPVIFDGDTGGMIDHFVYAVRTLERIGVSAII